MIEKNGGAFSATVTDSCTHLITTQKEVDSQAAKSEISLFQCFPLPSYLSFFSLHFPLFCCDICTHVRRILFTPRAC